MSTVAIVCIAWGIAAIAIRGPLVIAPEATARAYLGVIEKPSRIRAMACVLSAAGFATLAAVILSGDTLTHVFEFYGWIVVASSVFLLLLPGVYQPVARLVIEAFDPAALRMLGALGMGIGVALVYFGATSA